jgi:hypothetical protein
MFSIQLLIFRTRDYYWILNDELLRTLFPSLIFFISLEVFLVKLKIESGFISISAEDFNQLFLQIEIHPAFIRVWIERGRNMLSNLSDVNFLDPILVNISYTSLQSCFTFDFPLLSRAVGRYYNIFVITIQHFSSLISFFCLKQIQFR